MRWPSFPAVWKTTKARLAGAMQQRPRPWRRTILLVLAFAAMGAFILPRLLHVTDPRYVTKYGAPSPASQPANTLPLEEGDREGFNKAHPRGPARYAPASVAPAEPPAAPWGRRIIRRANLTIELSDVEAGISRLSETVEAFGGYVADTSTETDVQGTWRATITAYVPPDQFVRAIAALGGAGKVTSRRVSGQDVSEEFVDLEARVRNLERHEAQLLAFMGRAQKVADLLSLENELARVRGEIERLTGRSRFLRARTEMATIQIAITRAPLAAPPNDILARVWEQVWAAFLEAWYAAFRVAAALLVLAAQATPLALPALAAWALYRRWARRRAAAPRPVAPEAGQA